MNQPTDKCKTWWVIWNSIDHFDIASFRTKEEAKLYLKEFQCEGAGTYVIAQVTDYNNMNQPGKDYPDFDYLGRIKLNAD